MRPILPFIPDKFLLHGALERSPTIQQRGKLVGRALDVFNSTGFSPNIVFAMQIAPQPRHVLVEKYAELRLDGLAPNSVSLGVLDVNIEQLGRPTLANPF